MNKNKFEHTPYNEPLIPQRADPYVYKHTDGMYYFTASVPEYDRIVLRRADTIEGLATAEEVTVWKKHENGIMSKHIWAPELHFIEGAWYIYFAAGEAEDIWAIRPYVLTCDSKDPLQGTFRELGKMQNAKNDLFSFRDFSLDMTVFEYMQEWYCVWAEKVSVGQKISNLYIAKMETPWKLSTEQVLLTTPDYDWERVGFWVNEGPAFLQHEDKVYLTYSASATGACYCVGLLSAQYGSDLLDPASWSKSKEPVLKSDAEKGIYGPGHNSFVKSEDGRSDMMIFHARQYDEVEGDPLYDPNRHAYCMRIEWKEEKPVFDLANIERCKA
ncbi:MAG: family 43 glycosylhydrolase [bacterium]|nr:family 43 glycosylhydrolase [bacterium]